VAEVDDVGCLGAVRPHGCKNAITPRVSLAVGGRNLTDDYYELAWGFPQPGRTFYVKTRVGL
jgi:hypothetical protein